MDAFEYFVGCFVAMASVPPPFDDTSVVSVDNDASRKARDRCECIDE